MIKIGKGESCPLFIPEKSIPLGNIVILSFTLNSQLSLWRHLLSSDQLAWSNIWCRGNYSSKVKFKIPPTHHLYLNFTAACLLLFFRLIHCSVFVAVNLRLLVFGAPQHKWRSAPNILQLHSFHELESWQYWLIDWLKICLHFWVSEWIQFWLIDLLDIIIDWFVDCLIDWIGIYWFIWIGIWWRLCTCAYPVHNSPNLGRHIS